MPSPSPTDEPDVRIDAGRVFEYAPERPIGRDEYIRRLDVALGDAGTRVVTLVAWGGVGKTSLVAHWLAQLAQRNWPGLDRVFAWSFYSQGTREQGGVSAAFVKAALEFFGDTELAGSAVAARAKGQRIARLAAKHRTLLVLDGLEPLQHPPGRLHLEGRLQDPAIEALLFTLAQSRKSAAMGAFCVVTTRESVTDLRVFQTTTAPEWALEHLVPEAGAAVLWNAGAKRAGAAAIKADDQELRDASEEVDGHALTIQLLGSFLSRAHRGDIRKRSLVRFDKADAAVQGSHAFRVMGAYESWLTQGGEKGMGQLAVLRLLGLFDRPADPECLAALRARPAIPGLSEPLAGLGDEDWNLVVSALESAGLVKTAPWEPKPVKGFGEEKAKMWMAYRAQGRQFSLGEPEDFTPPHRLFRGEVLGTHPLLRQYFDKRLQDTSSGAWGEAHRRLYEHFKDSVPYWPEGLDGLTPLYQAVVHGCRAGCYREAFEEVLRLRLDRTVGYGWRHLGEFSATLGAVGCFFAEPWKHLAPGLPEYAEPWLFNEAGNALGGLGRLTEALEPLCAAVNAYERRQQHAQAAICALNLSEFHLILGNLVSAVGTAKQSTRFADRSGHWQWLIGSRTVLAEALHASGRWPKALELFQEAENIQAQSQERYYRFLYGGQGFWYCDLLLHKVERSAWATPLGSKLVRAADGEAPALADLLGEVQRRAKQTLHWANEAKASPLSIAVDRLTLARVALYRAVLQDGSVDPSISFH